MEPDDIPFKVTTLPPSYSDEDRRERDHLIEKIRELDSAYRAQLEQIARKLAKIDAKYPPRYVLTSVDPTVAEAILAKISVMK